MPRASRRRRRIRRAIACSIPTLLVAAVWLVSARTTLLAPGRALPQSAALGVADHQIQLFRASNAVQFEAVPPQLPRPANPGATINRQVTASTRVAGVFESAEGVEWHRTFATHFTMLGIPMWLPLALTSPLLLVAAWQLYRLRADARRRTAVCVNCGHEVRVTDTQCPACGQALPSVDPLGQAFLGAGPAGVTALQPRKPR